jgi:hypothetical protein
MSELRPTIALTPVICCQTMSMMLMMARLRLPGTSHISLSRVLVVASPTRRRSLASCSDISLISF